MRTVHELSACLARDAEDMSTIVEVDRLVRGLVDCIVDNHRERKCLSLERAVRINLGLVESLKAQLADKEKRLLHLGQTRTFAADLCKGFKKEASYVGGLVYKVEMLDGLVASYQRKSHQEASKYETVTTELATMNYKCKELENQVEILMTVQQEIQEQQWFQMGFDKQRRDSKISFDTILKIPACCKVVSSYLNRMDFYHLLQASKATCIALQVERWDCPLCGSKIQATITICPYCQYDKQDNVSDLKQELENVELPKSRTFWTRTGLSPFNTKMTNPKPRRRSTFDGLSVEQLRLVLSIDKRATHLENALIIKTTEIEDLKARLSTYHGTKAVLVKKLQESECCLRATMEQRDQSRAQVASDKEVISYLDLKVEELELKPKGLLDKIKALETQLAQCKEENLKLAKSETDHKAVSI